MAPTSRKGILSPKFKWPRRIAIALLIYTVAGFFLVPAIIKSQMLKRLPALTKRQAVVEQVRFNPYVLSLTIRGFSLKEPDGEVFSSFDEFYINFQLWASLFKQSWVFKEISLKKPFAQITYREDGNFNFANLLSNPAVTNSAPESKSPVKSQSLPRVVVYDLSVTNGGVAFADLKRKDPFHTQFLPINVNLTNLTTIRDKNSPYSFLARTDTGESFAWSGTITINPLRSAGLFRLGGLKLGKYSTYSHDYARFEIVNGVIDVAADYRYDSATNAMDLEVSKAAVHLSNLELKAPDTGERVIAIPSFSITDTDASVVKQTARVGLIKSSGGSLLVRQNRDGSINLLSLLNSLPAGAPPKDPAVGKNAVEEKNSAWSIKIDEIAFDNYTIKAEDKKPEKPASFNLDQLGFNLKGVSNASNAPVTASFSSRFQETGFIGVNGTATLMPPSADLQLALTNIDVRSIGPYMAEQIKVAITGGSLDLHGKARYASTEPAAPLMSFTGDLAMSKFATTDDVLFKDFVKWDSLTVDGIQLDMQPDKAHVKEVKFTGLNMGLVVGPDKRANLQTILRNQLGTAGSNTTAKADPPPPNAVAAGKKVPDVALDALVLDKASFHFGDQSLEPNCSFEVQELTGSIKGLSSKEDAVAIVDMKGNVDSRSPFSVTGKINPLAKDIFADVAVTFTNTELTAFTPYCEKFAGRPLEKGKLSLAVHYLIETNKLKAENGIFVDQLTLGPRNNSPDATKLPVKLAIALLKDRNGRIKLDIPVAGAMNDPKFKVGPIIWQVVENLMVKAATSPFSLLGAAFGGGEEMSYVTFEPGRSDVVEAEAKKLDTLAKALYERPALTLEINGSVDPARDREPLAQLKLEQQIKTLWVKELSDSGKPAVAAEGVTLEPRERERLLKKLYKQTLGRYKPTEAPTNQSPATIAQNKAARIMASIAEQEAHDHGASLLRTQPKPIFVPVKSGVTKAASASGKPERPKSRYELELEDMEAQLLQKVQVTDDDLRDLMRQRANKVQAYLLKTEKVAVGRLFITAPKPISASSKGQDRVNLSLD